MAKAERASLGCSRLLVAILVCAAAAAGWSQQLDVDELGTTAGRTFRFQSYAGPQPVVQTVEQIAGIGEVLSRDLRSGADRGTYFGKYTVIRAFQPSETALLSADIIVLGARAQIDDIRNVQRIVAGYLQAAFGYDAGQAGRLAVLVTTYNAAYRGNLAALSQKYTPLVMSNLTAENAGIALSYTEWPGKTRLIVPLGHAPGAQAGAAGAQPGAGPTGPAGPAGTAPAGPAVGAAAGSTSGGAAPSSGAAAAGGAQGGAAAAGGAAPAGGAAAGGAASGGAAAGGAAAPAGGAAAAAGGTAPAGGTGQAGGTGAGGTEGTGQAAAGGETAPASTGGTSAPGPAARGGTPGLFGIPWYWWLIGLAALLVLALLVFLIVRLVQRLMTPSYEREFARSVHEGHPLIEMIVIPQNRRIGHRNIHYLGPGATASVGSGMARFLIYFVPVPRRMALIKYDGTRYTFVPLKSDLFPGLSGAVSDCLDKGIAARSPRGYKFTIVFRRFIPPLEEINRLMRSTRPGAVRRIPPA